MSPRNWAEALRHDLGHAARLLRIDPVFTTVTLLSSTLGIRANTAVFQVLDAVRPRALPVRNPQELVEIRIAETPNGRTGGFRGRNPQLTQPLWEQIQAGQQGCSGLVA